MIFFGVDSDRDTPESIPNSEVKSISGDDNAVYCVKVARCQFFFNQTQV